MTKKVQKVLLIIFLTALIIALLAASFLYAPTYGRYESSSLGEDTTYDGDIEFIGTEQYVVNSPEELNDAIANGYSYIQISEDAEEPFVITTEVQDVATNLVLDLNGKVVVRNSRNPMLNVAQGVSVVLVYDSSDVQNGAFYNPVGSALQVSGGRLTVGSGNYESGPRANEYAGEVAAGTLSAADDSVTLYTRSSDQSRLLDVGKRDQTVYTKVEAGAQGLVPKLENGNYYQAMGALEDYSFVIADTFLVYTEEPSVDASVFNVPCDVASCDFYYYYQIEAGEDTRYAVVYGYWDVKELAEKGGSLIDDGRIADGLIWPYASIRMTAGEGYARGGSFVNQFDVANTYGIYSEQSENGATGTLDVSQVSNTESLRTTFAARGDAACIGCEAGRLTITGGSFSSELGNTIEMIGGTLHITAGTFTKDASSGETEDNGAAIYMQGGTLTIAHDTVPVQFTVTGSYVNGIEAQGGTIDAQNISLMFNEGSAGSHTTGIEAQGGTIKAQNATFTFNASSTGSYNTGILSVGGQVELTSCTFTMPGDNNRGIASQITEGEGVTGADEYDTSVTGSTFTIDGSNNSGVYASGGKTLVSGGELRIGGNGGDSDNFGIEAAGGTVDCNNATINVYGSSSAGIYTSGTDPQLNITGMFTCTVTQGQGNNLSSAAIMATGGSVTFETNGGSINSNGVGIVVRGGMLTQNGGTLTVNNWITTLTGAPNYGGTGIYIASGNFTQAAGGELTVNSTIVSTAWGDFITGNGINNTATQTSNGIYITGGSLIANGMLNVDHTGVVSDTLAGTAGNTALNTFTVRSHAVRVEQSTEEGAALTNVTINAGEITNSIGGGIYVSGGAVTLGSETTDASGQTTRTGPTISASGSSAGYSTFTYRGDNNGNSWQYDLFEQGGNAVQVSGGTLTVYEGTYSATIGNGILISGGTSDIYGGTFRGNAEGGSSRTGPGAHYGFKALNSGTITFNGGTFSGNNGGAFTMGSGNAATQQVTVNVLGGEFGTQAGGNNAFTVFQYSDVTFGTEETTNQNDSITISGIACALAVNSSVAQGNAKIQICAGKFHAIRTTNELADGIWFNNPYAQLEISGGEFRGQSGNNGRGLNLATNIMQTGGVKISGGTFGGEWSSGSTTYTTRYGIYYSSSAAVNDGLQISGGTFTGTSAALYLATNPDVSGSRNISISGGTFTVTTSNNCPIGYDINNNGMRNMQFQSIFASHDGNGVVQRFSVRVNFLQNVFTTYQAHENGWSNNPGTVWNVQQSGYGYATSIVVGSSIQT